MPEYTMYSCMRGGITQKEVKYKTFPSQSKKTLIVNNARCGRRGIWSKERVFQYLSV